MITPYFEPECFVNEHEEHFCNPPVPTLQPITCTSRTVHTTFQCGNDICMISTVLERLVFCILKPVSICGGTEYFFQGKLVAVIIVIRLSVGLADIISLTQAENGECIKSRMTVKPPKNPLPSLGRQHFSAYIHLPPHRALGFYALTRISKGKCSYHGRIKCGQDSLHGLP
jgi:hypothetical protein